MAATLVLDGSVTAANVDNIQILRDAAGSLKGVVNYHLDTPNPLAPVGRSADWNLSVAEKQAIVDSLLAGVLAAVEEDLGL